MWFGVLPEAALEKKFSPSPKCCAYAQ